MFKGFTDQTVGLTLVLAMLTAPLGASSSNDRLTYLTFSRSVALPTVTLTAGTYAFEVANSSSVGDVVRVRDKDGRAVYYMGLTRRIARPRGLKEEVNVVFGEASIGSPLPILAWFPPSASHGHEFVYRK